MDAKQARIRPSEKALAPGRAFTLAEANRALVLVRRIVADVIAEYRRLLDLQEALEAAEKGQQDDRVRESRLELIRAAGRLRAFLEELDDVGVELRDWALGVVDFPAVAGGRPVCLCWQHGEEAVNYWHEADTDYAGRQPIHTLPAEGEYAGADAAPAAGPAGNARR